MVVVEKSTVPAGSARRLGRVLKQERPDLRLEVVLNPEFLREGNAMRDSLEPDRILVGAHSEWAKERMRQLYRPLTSIGHRYIETSIATAELAKHACNAFLAMKISYANALAQMSERAGADVIGVVEVMGADRRLGHDYLNAGLGYGGYCFPKDVQAFGHLADKLGYDFPLLAEIERINGDAVVSVFKKIKEVLWNLEGKRICLLGLSFKPGTDDIRFSPALKLTNLLIQAGAEVVGYDPEAMHAAKAEEPGLHGAPDPYNAAEEPHCLVLCTEWDEIKALDYARIKNEMTYPIVIDGRNALDAETLTALGFVYEEVGRGSLHRYGSSLMPRSVVTGGTGFLGFHLCKGLLHEGWSVVCFDSFLTGSTDNISEILDEPNFEFVQYDVTKYLYVEGDVDWVFHFASPASPRDYLEHPIHTMKVGAIGK